MLCLFDEIQEVTDWQKACKTLRLHNTSVFITGSNSKKFYQKSLQRNSVEDMFHLE